jgi:hypothetical protein
MLPSLFSAAVVEDSVVFRSSAPRQFSSLQHYSSDDAHTPFRSIELNLISSARGGNRDSKKVHREIKDWKCDLESR